MLLVEGRFMPDEAVPSAEKIASTGKKRRFRNDKSKRATLSSDLVKTLHGLVFQEVP